MAILVKRNPAQRRMKKGGKNQNKNGYGDLYGNIFLLLRHMN